MSTTRPNIVLLVGEDVGLHLGCYGDTYARTPNLDRLASQGTRYTNAISTAPVCAPARSSIVTGMYPWSVGTHHMRSTRLNPPRLFTHELRDAGYHVNWFTKTDFNLNPPADFADDTSNWLDDLRHGTLPDKPFLLFRNFGTTHESTMWHQAYGRDGGARAGRLARQDELKPEHVHDPAQAPVPAYLPDHPRVRENIAWYYDALSMDDQAIGEVLDALDQSPYADNTIVIYMTDHGRGLPREKRWCYDAGIHLPLIVRWPGRLQPGTVSDELVNWVDIAPTLLTVTGTPVPDHYQGQPFLGATDQPPRAFAFAGRDRMDEAYDHVRVARDKRWHYIRNTFPQLPYAQCNVYMERVAATQVLREQRAAGELTGPAALWMSETKPPEELYDAQHDPQMIHNLADDPAHAETLARLRAALDAHLAEVGDLGAMPERELIAQGVVKDRMDEFAARIEPLPAPYRIGPERTVLEMHEAQRYQP
ncbi:MAG: sulfatase [Phycisphaeraceae bacterium]